MNYMLYLLTFLICNSAYSVQSYNVVDLGQFDSYQLNDKSEVVGHHNSNLRLFKKGEWKFIDDNLKKPDYEDFLGSAKQVMLS